MRVARRDRGDSSSAEFDDIPLLNNLEMADSDSLDDRTYLVNRTRRRTLWSCCTGLQNCCTRISTGICGMLCKKKTYSSRVVNLDRVYMGKSVSNAVRNQKYNLLTFIPLVLYEQFKYFLNLYFLIMALSQFIPAVKVGYLVTYWGPLTFVLAVSFIREAVDDLRRFYKDQQMNGKKYKKVVQGANSPISAANIRLGDIIVVDKNERVPADMILLRTTEKAGTTFIRTDQLDGETDWKLRVAVPATQQLQYDHETLSLDAEVFAEKPQKDIHNFVGYFKMRHANGVLEIPLNLENALWQDTVVASGTATGIVIYTGRETRSSMNTSLPSSKVGLLDVEVNNLTKVLFIVVVAMSFMMVCLKRFAGQWFVYFARFILLFSYIIPISLRVNLDMAKLAYAYFVGRDKQIPGTVVRSSTISEELGRIEYLLCDKTGTLTKNEMKFKKLSLDTGSFGADTFDEVSSHLMTSFATADSAKADATLPGKVRQSVEAIALCHNVTPMFDEEKVGVDTDAPEADQEANTIAYQAASPDEIALVTWSEQVGITLVKRDMKSMILQLPNGERRDYDILQMFPFTSETKRMGIIVKRKETGEITFYMKGADVIMSGIVKYNDWLDEECSNMAREGLRTLVVAKKVLTQQQYDDFERQLHQAKMSTDNRARNEAAVVQRLEKDLHLLCVTGVEDALQDDVRPTLEMLKQAGIRIWMLTGDKLETAICIAKSSGLFCRNDNYHVFGQVLNRNEAHTELMAMKRKPNGALVITGASLKHCIDYYESDLAELVCNATGVVCCRCSPEQKAQIVQLLIKYKKPCRVAAVGDGGNDVSMIQAAHAGIGIEGKEGKQASLASDFSITQFSHLQRLLLVHGRHCYKRSCSLSQFVMHRGLIISTMQAVFSCVFYFSSVMLFQGMLMAAYSTVYTNFPVFSLVMDKDVTDLVALTYPELYKLLSKGRSLSYKTFFLWFLVSVYQGAVIMYGALALFDNDFSRVVSISFTSLLFTELIMIGLTIHTWHWAMLLAEALSVIIYIASIFFMPFFDVQYMGTVNFMWKTAAITAVSCTPLYIIKCLRMKFAPPIYYKIKDEAKPR